MVYIVTGILIHRPSIIHSELARAYVGKYIGDAACFADVAWSVLQNERVDRQIMFRFLWS